MRIWFKCIKRERQRKVTYDSPFVNLDNSDYSCSELYLGVKSVVNIYHTNMVLLMSYSERDGILIKIKQNCPYQVLFDYVDGAYFINDESSRRYDQLIESLSTLKNQTSHHHNMEIFEKLETIMFEFADKYLGISPDDYS